MSLCGKIFQAYYKVILKREFFLKKIPKGFLETKIIFTHIPKAAGISIAHSIYGEQVGHFPLNLYKNILGVEFDEYFKFTFVRHPYSRFESAYYFLKSGGCNSFDKYYSKLVLSKYLDINDFVANYLTEKTIYEYIHFFPQSYFLEKDGKVLFDFLGYFENLEGDFEKLEAQLNIKLNLGNKNVTKLKKDCQLNSESLNKINILYSRDFEILDY